jgi:hypothetical protein
VLGGGDAGEVVAVVSSAVKLPGLRPWHGPNLGPLWARRAAAAPCCSRRWLRCCDLAAGQRAPSREAPGAEWRGAAGGGNAAHFWARWALRAAVGGRARWCCMLCTSVGKKKLRPSARERRWRAAQVQWHAHGCTAQYRNGVACLFIHIPEAVVCLLGPASCGR